MGRFERTKRLQTDLDALWSRIERLTASFERLETEWLDVRDQVRRSYQRLEKAGQRASPSPPPSVEAKRPLEEPTDPFSRKLLEVQRQTNDVPSRTEQSEG